MVIARSDRGEYGLHARDVTATDFHELRGETTEFVVRPTILVDTVGDERAQLEGGHAINIRYGRDGDVLVALDYQGLIAVTAYHHLAGAHAYFRDLGLGTGADDLARQQTLYQPVTDYGETLGSFVHHDNAAYDSDLQAFLLFEERWLDFVPLAANEGVITHEFAHSVFQHLVFRTVAAEPLRDFPWDQTSINMWRSANEGLADVHAVAFTGDPRFGRASGGRFVVSRDVSEGGRVLTQDVLASTTDDVYDPYPIGTVIASVFWDYQSALVADGWTEVDALREMGQLAYRTAAALRPRQSSFHIAELADTAARESVAGPGQIAFCASLLHRAELIMADVSACQ